MYAQTKSNAIKIILLKSFNTPLCLTKRIKYSTLNNKFTNLELFTVILGKWLMSHGCNERPTFFYRSLCLATFLVFSARSVCCRLPAPPVTAAGTQQQNLQRKGFSIRLTKLKISKSIGFHLNRFT